MSRIGFIGCGNMSQAIIGGVVKSKLVDAKDITASDVFKPNRDKCEKDFGVVVSESNIEAAKDKDIIVLAVKPHIYPLVIEKIKDIISNECIIISIAAGQSIANLERQFNKGTKIVKTMPNTPAMVNAGMTAGVANKHITEGEKDYIEKLLSSFGEFEWVNESMMDAVTAVSGSSPAYVYMFIEAMADAAVLGGLPRVQAYKFAAQAVLGSAKMVMETGMHPGVLKDNVCSPGGTTIEAVATLEKTGFRNSVIEAMIACMDKSKAMSK